MPFGAASWSLTEDDSSAIRQVMQRFLFDSNARSCLLVDRSGQLVTTAGERLSFDATAFASLAAADFAANDQLARLIGERDFSTLFHQGERESMLLADVARRVILVVLFDNRTTLGMVRLKLKHAVDEMSKIVDQMFARAGAPRRGPAVVLGDVDDEIDRLFQ
jgi:predicted regulator of Ras-like GTPase activity (Roadblock/LC7/MglB family)